jgi:hypothetical protein
MFTDSGKEELSEAILGISRLIGVERMSIKSLISPGYGINCQTVNIKTPV